MPMKYVGILEKVVGNKDIMIDSSFLGVDGTVEYLAEAVRRKFS